MCLLLRLERLSCYTVVSHAAGTTIYNFLHPAIIRTYTGKRTDTQRP